jgi:hypothetical protein
MNESKSHESVGGTQITFNPEIRRPPNLGPLDRSSVSRDTHQLESHAEQG